MKYSISLLMVLVMTLAAVSIALAAPPDNRQIIEDEVVWNLQHCLEFTGVDVWVKDRAVFTVRIDTFYDKDGNWIKEKGQVKGTHHLFVNESYKLVEGKYIMNWTAYEDPETGLIFSHEPGNWWQINLPGYGNLVHFAGLEDYLYGPGPDDWELIKGAGLRAVDPVFLCEYLTPPPP